MKNLKILYLPIVCMMMALNFVACNDEDDKNLSKDHPFTINGTEVKVDYSESAFNIGNDPMDIDVYASANNRDYDFYLEWEGSHNDMAVGYDLTKAKDGLWLSAGEGFDSYEWYECTSGSVVVKEFTKSELSLQFNKAIFKDDQNHTIELNGVLNVRIHY